MMLLAMTAAGAYLTPAPVVYGGLAWQNISYQQQVLTATNQQVTSALIVGELKLFRFDKTNLIVTATVLPALSNPGRLHTNLNAAYYVKLWGKLTWNLSFYGNWDNQPPRAFLAATTAPAPALPTYSAIANIFTRLASETDTNMNCGRT